MPYCRKPLFMVIKNKEIYECVFLPVTSFLEFWFPVKTRKDVHSYLYSWWGRHYSIAGYWKDPFHLKEYLKKSEYLPYLDNDVSF